MASYLQLAWSFVNFLYEDEEEETPEEPKWILHATNNGTQSSNTGCLGSRVLWKLSFILLAIITAYAIMCLCKNNTYRRYIRGFRPPRVVTDVVTSMRNRLLRLTYHSTAPTTEETLHPRSD